MHSLGAFVLCVYIFIFRSFENDRMFHFFLWQNIKDCLLILNFFALIKSRIKPPPVLRTERFGKPVSGYFEHRLGRAEAIGDGRLHLPVQVTE